jgi:hypothetical protein
MFVALSLIQEKIKDKLNLIVALGPVANLKDCKSEFLTTLAPAAGLVFGAANLVGIYDIFPTNNI